MGHFWFKYVVTVLVAGILIVLGLNARWGISGLNTGNA